MISFHLCSTHLLLFFKIDISLYNWKIIHTNIFVAFKAIFSAIIFTFYVAAIISKNFIILIIISAFTLHLIFKLKWSAMKLICTWCWLQIYCLATVKSRDYQKFEWHWDAAWWWSAVHWSRAEFSRSRRLW